MPVYAEHLRNIIKQSVNREDGYDKPLRGFHICVDAGNGGGGYFATDVLAPLGADISGLLMDTCSCGLSAAELCAAPHDRRTLEVVSVHMTATLPAYTLDLTAVWSWLAHTAGGDMMRAPGFLECLPDRLVARSQVCGRSSQTRFRPGDCCIL